MDMSNMKLVDLKKQKASPKFFVIKRFFDIVLSLLGLIVLMPIFLIVFISMYIEEKELIFIFTQERVGLDGEIFKMYKIRSMCLDAEKILDDLLEQNDIDGAMFKMKNDPRVTKVGRFIRKTSIDELPQLFNVLRGDMSLVGPRPPLEREVKEYTNYDLQRLSVKPGCTGLWQVSGRNNVSFAEMVELDLKYIENQNLLNDVKIILKTILVMINSNGAY